MGKHFLILRKKCKCGRIKLGDETITPVENHSSGYCDEIHAAGGSCCSALLGISHFHTLLLSEK